jgi:hypothetical protein
VLLLPVQESEELVQLIEELAVTVCFGKGDIYHASTDDLKKKWDGESKTPHLSEHPIAKELQNATTPVYITEGNLFNVKDQTISRSKHEVVIQRHSMLPDILVRAGLLYGAEQRTSGVCVPTVYAHLNPTMTALASPFFHHSIGHAESWNIFAWNFLLPVFPSWFYLDFQKGMSNDTSTRLVRLTNTKDELLVPSQKVYEQDNLNSCLFVFFFCSFLQRRNLFDEMKVRVCFCFCVFVFLNSLFPLSIDGKTDKNVCDVGATTVFLDT